ncbi:hypothetical protein CUN61_21815 [Pseudomonas arsenicoxydans]|uniref:Uncharacterized protein n=1 Tax=Pseudomonas arsenicoxydans TaxID=702115 RepID=A0A4P6G6V0_9PSED|nr:hypothetical protein CUN61_21815 [Pseudomonas arsenicoxydans]
MVVETVAEMAVAIAAVRVAAIATRIMTVAPTATDTVKGWPAIMPARQYATVVKAETVTAVIAVTEQRLLVSPIPKIRAA